MRKIMAITLVIATSVAAAAKNISDWTKVQGLKAGTEVQVVDRFGNPAVGYVTSVSQDALNVDVSATGVGGLLSPRSFSRADVHEVYKLGKKFHRRLSGRNLMIASAVGLLAGIGIGAAVDQAHPSAEDPGQGKLIGGVLGFFSGPAALAIGRAVISSLHRTKLIYRAPPDQTTEPSQPKAAATHPRDHLNSSIQMCPRVNRPRYLSRNNVFSNRAFA